MLSLNTARLTLIANDAELAPMQAHDHLRFCAALGVAQPAQWPPEPFGEAGLAWAADQLARDQKGAGWYGWFLLKEQGGAKHLIGAAALVGRPDHDGEVEIGFGVLPDHAGEGYASEAVRALVDWAIAAGAKRVIAHLDAEDDHAARTLEQNGFLDTLDPPYPGVARWALVN